MTDQVIKGISANKQVRIVAADTRQCVKQAVILHQASPVAAAALGRSLTAGILMGAMLKQQGQRLSLLIKGNGPLGSIAVTADTEGGVKGYVTQPAVDLPFKAGKLDVAGAVGQGHLTVTYDLGLKEPYAGTIDLISGEIAEDLTHYYAVSEQTPSVVALGVLVNRQELIRQSGGFIVQLLPGADEATIEQLEKNMAGLDSVTALMEDGQSINDIMQWVMAGLDLQIIERKDCAYYCDCSKQRFEKGLVSLGRKELTELVVEGQPIETTCHFCNTVYSFEIEEIIDLLKQMP